MSLDPEYILNELSKLETGKFPELAVQTLLELATITEYTHLKEGTRDKSHENPCTVKYEMGMFTEDELNILESEYKSYLGFDAFDQPTRVIRFKSTQA